MFIFKNAIRCILRSKGRNVLLGIISLVIAVSACLGLSIRQAAESAKVETLSGMSVTATISFDRQSMMGNMGRPDAGGFDFGNFGGGFGGGGRPSMPGGDMEDMGKNPFTNYITKVNSAMNLTVVVQLLGIGLLLTLIAGTVSVLFIMRYNPLKILSNRD